MRLTGKAHQFFGDVLPPDFRAEIFGLVDAAWPNIPNPRDAWLEPRITGLLQHAMIAKQETRYKTDPPFYILEDVKKRNTKTGKEKERTDVEIHLRHHYIKGQKPYFVFESKRLNVVHAGVLSSNSHEYLGEGGLGCLLDGAYGSVSGYCGMLAHVMDGDVTKAKRAVEKQMTNKSEELQMDGEPAIHCSPLMPTRSPHGETHHKIGTQKHTIFHMFLPAKHSPSQIPN